MDHAIDLFTARLCAAHWTLLLAWLGLLLLSLGQAADLLVEEASDLARRWGVSAFAIGATVVSVGTTLPETTVSTLAGLRGEAGLALGNAVGSVSCNLGLILAVACLGGARFEPDEVRGRGWVQLAAGALVYGLCLACAPVLPIKAGLLLLGLAAAYLWHSVRRSSVEPAADQVEAAGTAPLPAAHGAYEAPGAAGTAPLPVPNFGDSSVRDGPDLLISEVWAAGPGATSGRPVGSPGAAGATPLPAGPGATSGRPVGSPGAAGLARLAASLALLAATSRLLIPAAQQAARLAGVPDDVIAATLVSCGTSAPELFTCIAAVMRGQGGLALGNILGADILDLLLVSGAACAVSGRGLPVPGTFFRLHLPAMAGLVVISQAGLARAKGRLDKGLGMALLGFYAAYVLVQYWLLRAP